MPRSGLTSFNRLPRNLQQKHCFVRSSGIPGSQSSWLTSFCQAIFVRISVSLDLDHQDIRSLDHQKLSGNLQNSDKVSVRSSGF